MMRCILCEVGAFCQHFCIAEFAFFVREIVGGQTNYDFGVLQSFIRGAGIALPAGFCFKLVFRGSDPGTPTG
jgi:hypothetical protein